jgi:nucleoside-diphosphate-sugar epimerase
MEYDQSALIERLNEYTSPIIPIGVYGRAKHETRIAAEDLAKNSGLSFAWGRIFNLYGPHEARGRFVSNVINAMLEGNIPQIDPGDLTFDYLYVADVASALVALLSSNVTGIVNIASGRPVTLKTMAEAAAEILGCPELVRAAPPAQERAPMRAVADVERLMREVGWKPQYSLHAGLEKTIAWWRMSGRVKTIE